MSGIEATEGITGETTSRGSASDEQTAIEVREPAGRRVYSVEYKRGILAEIDAAPHGGVGAILRREGIYMSMIRVWRSQAASGGSASQPGVKPLPLTPMKRDGGASAAGCHQWR